MSHWNKIYKIEGEDYAYYDIFEPHEDMKKVARVFKDHHVKKILDLGCGAGRNLMFLAKKNFDMTGLDLAPEGLTLIEKSLKKDKIKVDLKVGSFFNKLPYPNNSFDAIVSVQVLQHGTEKQIRNAIQEMKRVLKPKGLIFITLCGRLSHGKVRLFLVKTAKKIASQTYAPTQGQEKGLTHYIYNKKEIARHFRGFKIIKLWKDEKDYYCFLARLTT